MIRVFILFFLFQQFISAQNSNNMWKANLKIDEQHNIPFYMNLVESKDSLFLEIINGDEHILVPEVQLINDSIRFELPLFNSYVIASLSNDKMSGFWYKPSRGDYKMSFEAKKGNFARFDTPKKLPIMDISGKWEVKFSPSSDDEYIAIGEFNQKDNHLTGTFRTTTGDYRFLEGNINGNLLQLSCFDGSHAFLFEGEIDEMNNITGTFWSGHHWKEPWIAFKNDNVTLPDPLSLTYLNEGETSINFSFNDTNGDMVSLKDERYENKVVVVQILGTWCPNCMDETAFYAQVSKDFMDKNVEFVSIAFETKNTWQEAAPNLKKYQQHFDLQYPILYGGKASKKVASEAFPQLNKIISFPTTIILDKNHQVYKIHTGFNGPATSEYDRFVDDFIQTLNKLTKE